MKRMKLILALTMTIAMSLGVTAYGNTESTIVIHQKAELGKITGMTGYDYIKLVLKNKFDMTDAEITAGLNLGKTLFDIAQEKGMTLNEFKTAILEEKNKAVADGKITPEEGDSQFFNLLPNVYNSGSFTGST